jgi:carbamoyltransferase
MKKMTKLYIGMATSQHDPAIAIIDDEGEILFAEATERSSKNKRAWNIVPDQIGPIENIIDKYIDNNVSEVILCASWSSSSLRFSPYIFIITYLRKKFGDKLSFSYLENSSLRLAMYKAPNNLRDMFLNIEHRILQKNKDIKLHKVGVDHHLAHAYTAISSSSLTKPYVLLLMEWEREVVLLFLN